MSTRRDIFRVGVILLALSALVGRATAQTQVNDESAIQAAIDAGIRTKESGALTLRSRPGWRPTRPVTLSIEGPLTRVQRAAAEAARTYKPFTRVDVAEELLHRTLVVRVSPDPPSPTGGSPTVTHVVLQAVGQGGAAVQPSHLELVPLEWENAFGGKFQGQGAVATFALDAIPTGDFEVVVVTDMKQETRIKVSMRDRAKIR